MSLIDKVGRKTLLRIGVTVDIFHANIEEKNIPNTIRFLGKNLKHIHVSENDRGLLGSGHVDFRGLVEALHSIEYDGFLVVEGFGYSVDQPGSPGYLLADTTVSPEEIAFAGATYLRQCIRPVVWRSTLLAMMSFAGACSYKPNGRK